MWDVSPPFLSDVSHPMQAWVRNVFLNYEDGGETSFWNISWVLNVFLNYEDGGKTSFLFMGRGRNVFPKYELGAKRLTKKWCKLTMGRKVCVPVTQCMKCVTNIYM